MAPACAQTLPSDGDVGPDQAGTVRCTFAAVFTHAEPLSAYPVGAASLTSTSRTQDEPLSVKPAGVASLTLA